MTQDDIDASSAPLVEHLIELRRRLIYVVIALVSIAAVAFIYIEPIFWFLADPLLRVDPAAKIIFTSPQEAFFSALSLAIYCGLVIGFPFIAAQVWIFVAPGLYQNEKSAFLPFLVATPFLFLAGAALAYYVVIPLALNFLINGFQFVAPEGAPAAQIVNENRISEYIGFTRKVLFAFGACFQLPVLLLLLGKAGIVNAEQLKGGRPYAVVGIAAVAAILTPPDIISQIILIIPVYALYEVSIHLVRLAEKRHKEQLRKEGLLDEDEEAV